MGKHLTFEQRCRLAALHRSGLTQHAIAAQIGISQSAVSRELCRNQSNCGYDCQVADKTAAKRRAIASSRPRTMTAEVIALVKTKLGGEQWSPQQISFWLAMSHQIDLSHESIYRHIWADKRGGKLAGRGIIAGRIDIDQRPAIVEQRIRIGDWEADTILGAGRKGAILSLVERTSRYTLLHKLEATQAEPTTLAIIARLRPHRARVHTITADNGKEFAFHARVAARLAAGFYFAKPYHAWERGLNENTNGLVRQYFPKGTSFARVTPAAVARVQNKLNSRPRKVLGYKTPNEVFFAA